MTPQQIGGLLMGISFGLLLIMVIVTIVVPTKASRAAKYARQRAALSEAFATEHGPELELDWARYGEVPKPEVLALAGEHAWQLVSDKLVDDAWWLRFRK